MVTNLGDVATQKLAAGSGKVKGAKWASKVSSDYQHQNPIEHQIQNLKQLLKNTIDHTGTPAKFWLLCLFFLIGLCNVLAIPGLALVQST